MFLAVASRKESILMLSLTLLLKGHERGNILEHIEA